MNIKTRLHIIVFVSVATILGLYGYIVKITLDIDREITKIELVERFEENVFDFGLTVEYFLDEYEQRYVDALQRNLAEIEMLSTEIEDFDRYHIVRESIPSIRSALELLKDIEDQPDLYADETVRDEVRKRAANRIRSDVMQLTTISHYVVESRLQNIRTLQVDQRIDFLLILIPAILALIIVAYYMQRLIITSLKKLQKSTQKIASGNLEERIELNSDDELGELADQFNLMAQKIEETVHREKQLNEQLEEQARELKATNKELENFASVASHDLKEPLRMIRSFMELLQKRYADDLDENARQYIHFAVDGSKRMTNLINDLLEFSRVGRIYTEFEEINMQDLLDEIVLHYKPQIEESGAEINIGEMPVIEAEPTSMKLIFQNLISNAIKYQKEGASPKIDIQSSETESDWKFSISDNGIGIPDEYKEQVFQLFKRLHSVDEFPGSGMGLATCKKIIEQHGGTIWVESEPGEGSTFYFRISKMIAHND